MNRINLHQLLCLILDSNNVYYQAPPNQMLYPCIIYNRNSIDIKYANDKTYKNKTRYTLTLITKNPDCDQLINSLLSIQYCSFDRQYIADNMYHCVFNIYY